MSHTFLNPLTLGVDYYFSCQMPFQILSALLSNMVSNYENRHLSLTAADHQFDMDVGRGIPLYQVLLEHYAHLLNQKP